MPFVPHTPDDVSAMLSAIDVENIQQLFDEIPAAIPTADLKNIPTGLTEMEVTRLMLERAPQYEPAMNFIGAGAYEHFIPALSWDILSRGEFYTAYTPYQAEASQGSLQLIYEYQTMMANLMGLDVSNASLYEGASALAEAVLMAVRIKRGQAKRVLVPRSLHPYYREVLTTVLEHQDILLESVPFDPATGKINLAALNEIDINGLAALIIPQPNFFGVIEEVDALVDAIQAKQALAIACVNPVAMALLKEPGKWGKNGADIACGEGQSLGVPLAFGGPYFGFMCCKEEYVRQMPGRIVGRSHDEKNRSGYTLTLQAREQHIRRSKATSNICTNQGLMVVAATIYMTTVGAKGLKSVAAGSHHNANALFERCRTIEGIQPVFASPFFHEFVIKLTKPVDVVLTELSRQGLQAGISLKSFYPELGESLLVCATEIKTKQDLERYQQWLAKAVG